MTFRNLSPYGSFPTVLTKLIILRHHFYVFYLFIYLNRLILLLFLLKIIFMFSIYLLLTFELISDLRSGGPRFDCPDLTRSNFSGLRSREAGTSLILTGPRPGQTLDTTREEPEREGRRHRADTPCHCRVALPAC